MNSFGRYWDIHFPSRPFYLFFLLLSNKNGEKTGCAPFAWNMSVRSRPTKGNQNVIEKKNNKNNLKKKKLKKRELKIDRQIRFSCPFGNRFREEYFLFFYLLLWLFLSSSLFFFISLFSFFKEGRSIRNSVVQMIAVVCGQLGIGGS